METKQERRCWDGINASLKCTETRDEPSTCCTCNLKLISRCLSSPDATSLPTSLPQEQAAKTNMLSVVRIQQKEYLVLCSYFETFVKYLLFTKYLTSTNMPTAQQKKGHYLSHTAQIREALLYVTIKSLRPKQHCCMGISLLTKKMTEIKPKNIF